MATQVVTLEQTSGAQAIALRDDVDGAFIVVTAARRPVALAWLDRPVDGRIDLTRALAGAFSRRTDARVPRVDSTRTRLSIVVCTHERPDDLARCLASLSQARGTGHEVIVVDNSPNGHATARVARSFGVRLITEPRPGLNRARNAGVAAAGHEIVAFVDDDVVVSPTWAEEVVSACADRTVACVTGLVLPLELETTAQEQFERYSHQRRDLQPRRYSRHVLPASAAGVVGMGANMAFRRAVLLELGGFDPRLDAGTRTQSAGDTDMFARVLDAGHSIVYSPDAFAWHRHRRTSSEVRACVFGYGVGLWALFTKRVFEQGDMRALVTATRWLVGPLVKAAGARLSGAKSAPWSVVLSETAGAFLGPYLFALETWNGDPETPEP